MGDPRLPSYDDPFTDLPSRRTTVEVQPVAHEHGRAWYWLDAIRALYAACDRCRPSVPCWRHEVIVPVLAYREEPRTGAELADGLALGCVAASVAGCKSKLGGIGGVTVEKHGGGSWSSVCLPCTATILGPVLDPEAAT